MRLSIVIPMYNVENYIGNCIESLIKQNISQNDYEIIIINDGSTDKSLLEAKKYEKEYNNIEIITVQNGGLGRARNLGMDNAKGQYLFFVDSDDYIVHNCLEQLMHVVESNELDILFFEMKRTEKLNDYTENLAIESNLESIMEGWRYFASKNVNNGACHFIIRKNYLEEKNIKFAEGKYCEDGMFSVKAITYAKRVAYTKQYIYRYVIRDGSIVTKRDKNHKNKMIEDFIYAICYFDKFLIEVKKDIVVDQEYNERIISKRNSYVFFLLIRIIKANLSEKELRDKLSELKEKEIYPFKRMNKEDYKSIKYDLLHFILNNEVLLKVACRIYKIR